MRLDDTVKSGSRTDRCLHPVPPGCGAELPLEGVRERVRTAVADPTGDAGQGVRGIPEEAGGEDQAPPRQIGHRRTADQRGEPARQRGARGARGSCQAVDRPRGRRVRVDGPERGGRDRVSQCAGPGSAGGLGHPGTDHVDEQEVEQVRERDARTGPHLVQLAGQQVDRRAEFEVTAHPVRQVDDLGQLRHERVQPAAVEPVLAAEQLGLVARPGVREPPLERHGLLRRHRRVGRGVGDHMAGAVREQLAPDHWEPDTGRTVVGCSPGCCAATG
jgi:hypothetical protein